VTWGDVAPPITAMGKAAAATLAFRAGAGLAPPPNSRSGLRVTAVVKATFALVPDAAMAIVDPEPIARADKHRDGQPGSSLVVATELVPFRSCADVLLFGTARAPHEQPTPAMGVRLMVAQGPNVVLDKRLAVRGAPDPSGRTREPKAFAAMQLAWELAARTADNPAGIQEGAGAWPHIVDPKNRERAAGFGPISPRWPSRRRLLEALDEAGLGEQIPSLRAEFPWAYFNAAPEDQRIPFVRGDEWIGFEGMHHGLARVVSCLPGVRAAARVYRGGEQGQPIALEADTLVIDTDRLVCSVVWRGSFPVASEQDLAAIHVLAGIETAPHPLAFPPSNVEPARQPAPVALAKHPMNTTLTLGVDEVRRLAAATPFENPPNPRPASEPPPKQVLAPAGAPPPPRAHPLAGSTIALDVAGFHPMAPAMPFQVGLPATPRIDEVEPAPATAPSPDAHPIGSTLLLDVSVALRIAPAVPFTPNGPSAKHDAAPARATPLPPATPFEQAFLPAPPEPEGPVTLDLGRRANAAAAAPFTIGQMVTHAAPPALAQPHHDALRAPAPTATAPEPGAEPAAPPKTLGGFFLAAMARAGQQQAAGARA
jgi:hypothetical protein